MVAHAESIDYDGLYIGGDWHPSTSGQVIEVTDPCSEMVVGHVPAASIANVDRAVDAARAAFGPWASTSPKQRVELCAAIGEGIKARRDELAAVICHELGMPVEQARTIQVDRPAMTFSSMIDLLPEIDRQERIGNSLIVREPAGVVAAITPWNFPLHQIAAKIAPALAAGCTVVLKPASLAPLNAFVLAEIIDAAGVPAGVFNLLAGEGATVGEALVSSPGVDMVTFTGSTVGGGRVAELAAATVKRVALELGGKSANVILDDADIARAVRDGLGRCFMNSGQTCSALTRMLVPRAHLASAEAVAVAAVEEWTTGDPFDATTKLGPLVSARQRDSVREYIEVGIAEGATLIAGGPAAPAGLSRGYFVRPTIFSGVDNGMRVAQEEIFGPVLVMIPHDGDDHAVEIANASPYGLSGGVWSRDLTRAMNIAGQLRTGQVAINGGPFNLLAPFGGYKQSGYGRELGRYGVDEFLQVKAMQFHPDHE